MKKLLLFFCLSFQLFAETTIKESNFSLDRLMPFFPNSDFLKVKEGHPDFLTVSSESGPKIIRISYKSSGYLLPIYIHEKDNKVVDFFIRLPSYFVHDLFHQSLINKFGKQDSYFTSGQNALYLWNNKEGNRHIYAATCTITCFPIYYTVSPATIKKGESLWEKFLKNEL